MTLISSHTTCTREGCGHAADEHSRNGCQSLLRNSPRLCRCAGLTTAQPVPDDTLAIATADDIVTSLPADLLVAALRIAADQLDDCADSDAQAYGVGIDTAYAADAARITLLAALADIEAAR